MEKTTAPDGFHDAKLVSASYEHTENGSAILEMEYSIGDEYFWAKEGIWLVNAPSGDAATDENRKQWTKDSIERIKEVYPEAVKDGKLVLTALLNPSEEILAKVVRIKVTTDGKFSKCKVFPSKISKRRISREDALKMAIRDQRALAAFGISLDAAPAAEQHVKVVAGTPEADAMGLDF